MDYGGWKRGPTAKSAEVRTKCAASMWTHRWRWLPGRLLLISTPCCPEDTFPISEAGRQFARRTAIRQEQKHICEHSGVLSWPKHTY